MQFGIRTLADRVTLAHRPIRGRRARKRKRAWPLHPGIVRETVRRGQSAPIGPGSRWSGSLEGRAITDTASARAPRVLVLSNGPGGIRTRDLFRSRDNPFTSARPRPDECREGQSALPAELQAHRCAVGTTPRAPRSRARGDHQMEARRDSNPQPPIPISPGRRPAHGGRIVGKEIRCSVPVELRAPHCAVFVAPAPPTSGRRGM